jgi:hypothetical protein
MFGGEHLSVVREEGLEKKDWRRRTGEEGLEKNWRIMCFSKKKSSRAAENELRVINHDEAIGM